MRTGAGGPTKTTPGSALASGDGTGTGSGLASGAGAAKAQHAIATRT